MHFSRWVFLKSLQLGSNRSEQGAFIGNLDFHIVDFSFLGEQHTGLLLNRSKTRAHILYRFDSSSFPPSEMDSIIFFWRMKKLYFFSQRAPLPPYGTGDPTLLRF